MFKLIRSTNEDEFLQQLSKLKKEATIVNIHYSATVGAVMFYSALVEIKDESNGNRGKSTRAKFPKKSN